MITTAPCTSSKLQVNVQANLNRWMGPCYTAPYEHITACANDHGEVYLTGLVDDHQIVDEALQMVKGIPGVTCITDQVTVLYHGAPVRL